MQHEWDLFNLNLEAEAWAWAATLGPSLRFAG
jgi:hypothetical protein